jgi:choline dehydrogenase
MDKIADEWQDKYRTPLDFIIVGAGAGGAPLAARLVERGFTVLVIEMGPAKPDRPPQARVENTEVPLLHTETTEDPRHSLRFFVDHFDGGPQKSLDGKVRRPPDVPANAPADEQGIFYPRAQGVGGCTVHNAMITICGLSEDWDEIAEATGDASWRGERMRPYFERLERCHYARPTTWLGRLRQMLGLRTGWENSRHGLRGWLATTLTDLRFLKRDCRLLAVVLGGALAAVRAGVDRFGELLRTFLRGRTLPSLDPNHWETMRRKEEGVSRIPCAITPHGERSSPRGRLLGLLEPSSPHRERLHLLTEACVTSLVLEDADRPVAVGGKTARLRARGIRCLRRAHTYEADPQHTDPGQWSSQLVTLRCRREVILCGGAFNTPQLLMLSGIGPGEHLKKVKVGADGDACRVELPGVGQNLQDRYEVPIIATVTDRFRSLDGIGLTSTSPDRLLETWRNNKGKPAFDRGLYATNGGLVGIFVRSNEEDAAPDLFIFALAGYFPGYHVGYSKPAALIGRVNDDPEDYRRRVTWLILKARTRHRQGEVLLRSANPFQRPSINFRSFPLAPDAALQRKKVPPPASPQEDPYVPSDDKDLEALVHGVGFVRQILEYGREKGTIQQIEQPHSEDFGGNDRMWIKHTAWGHHACGTCRIGNDTDEGAVLDSRFRVRGVQGLRVVDASVFPRIPGFFIVANVYMIAEKAADVLTEDHPRPAKDLPPEVVAALRQDPVLPSSYEFEARRVYPVEMEQAEARLIAARRKAANVGLRP